MIEVGVLEAKTRFSKLLEAALAGEDVVITRNGKRMVRLSPVDDTAPKDVLAHVRELRARFEREAPNPQPFDLQADLDELRGRD